jgi:hypothetical protein
MVFDVWSELYCGTVNYIILIINHIKWYIFKFRDNQNSFYCLSKTWDIYRGRGSGMKYKYSDRIIADLEMVLGKI